MMNHNFKNLIIWQKAMEIATLVFEFTKTLPEEERYGMRSQLNRSGYSIPSNIAEGSGRNTKKHFVLFLSFSLSSSYELETQLLICEKIQLGDKTLLSTLLSRVQELQKMIYTYRNKLINHES